MPSMNVSLTPELIKIIRAKVKKGLYNNASEVIREAIRQLDTNAELIYQLKLDRLKKALEPGLRDLKEGRFAEYSLEALQRDLDRNPSA